jgi:hypothetical protein
MKIDITRSHLYKQINGKQAKKCAYLGSNRKTIWNLLREETKKCWTLADLVTLGQEVSSLDDAQLQTLLQGSFSIPSPQKEDAMRCHLVFLSTYGNYFTLPCVEI